MPKIHPDEYASLSHGLNTENLMHKFKHRHITIQISNRLFDGLNFMLVKLLVIF